MEHLEGGAWKLNCHPGGNEEAQVQVTRECQGEWMFLERSVR